jgi:anti-sigma regulatory factor (Ser/Thr protein kinase)
MTTDTGSPALQNASATGPRWQSLPAVPESVREARRFAASLLGEADADHLGDVVLVVSELITNAVREVAKLDPAPGMTIDLGVDVQPRWTHLHAVDAASALPKEIHQDPLAGSGRGIPIINSLAALTWIDQEQEGVRFDWADPATYGPAVAGVDRVYLVAPIGVADPAPMVEPFLGGALSSGVRRVVLLSSSAVSEGASGLGALHRMVSATVPEWAVLRASWFMQNFLGEHLVAAGIRTAGEIVTATGKAGWPSSTPTTSPPSPYVRCWMPCRTTPTT